MSKLTQTGAAEGVATLSGRLEQSGTVSIGYATRTGALLRVDGQPRGAFDREHAQATLDVASGSTLTLEVEEHGLPTNALPSGDGLKWWWLNARGRQTPSLELSVAPAQGAQPPAQPAAGVPIIGHSHLDVAWLWDYEQTQRKALRTFAIAANLLERFAEFVFSQSQPQLYEFVEQSDAPFLDRIAALAREGRFDASIAAMWVEPDCNLPSGESLLRQLFYAHEYCVRRLGVTPQVAWLPDSFGFANTLPTLLAHAGIRYFATTKLRWNDTTPFPFTQFLWRGPDGSEILSALLASYDGGISPARLALARERNEPVVAGFGDGGGGVTEQMIGVARETGHWVRPLDWFELLNARRAELPVHQDELYLEYHRGVYTTHHNVKAANARLERELECAEEAAAWCVAVRAPADLHAAFRTRLDAVWKIVLRNQFHDVLPGTSVGAVYDDVRAEYDAAGEMLAAVRKGTASVLPRGAAPSRAFACRAPVAQDDGAFVFDNGLIRARLSGAGIISELAYSGGTNVVSQANVLALYRDRPKHWDAWNIDAGYDKRVFAPKHGAFVVENGELRVPFSFGKSAFEMRVSLRSGEPFVRVELDCDWETRHMLLRVENWLPLRAQSVTYGTPHGTIERSATAASAADRAKFEVPGQRFAFVRDASAGLVLFALDTYGWSARTLPKGGVHLGHSLLRGSSWPDPTADRGHNTFRYAFAPVETHSIGAIESAWSRFAHEQRVRLFVCEQEAILVTAVKPAFDGRGVIMRVRECDGVATIARIRCGARVRSIEPVDALERPCAGTVTLDEEFIVAPMEPFTLRSFRAHFS